MKTGNALIGFGIALILVGIVWRMGWMSWFGRLPGDIRREGERGSVFIPITSMLVISFVGSILLNIITRPFGGE